MPLGGYIHRIMDIAISRTAGTASGRHLAFLEAVLTIGAWKVPITCEVGR